MTTGTRPRILFICTASPFGTSGAGVRTRHIAQILASIGDLTLIAATEREWTAEQLAATRAAYSLGRYIVYQQTPVTSLAERWAKLTDRRFMNTNGVQVAPADREAVAEMVAKHDVVWIHTLKVANAFRRFEWPHTVVDVDDFPSRFHASAAAQAKNSREKLRRLYLSKTWARREALCLQRFSRLVVCKEEDRHHFGDAQRVDVVPNGFARPDRLVDRDLNASSPRIGMIGDFGYLPNSDGLRWFVKEAWPSLARQHPSVSLRLVGKTSDTLGRSFQDPRIQGLGYVDDTAAEMATWSAMIAPTRLGGGTSLKVVEGLARQIPIVSSSHGARGYPIVHGQQALLADTGADFAAACLKLVSEPATGQRLARAGFELFEREFSWDAIAPRIARVLERTRFQADNSLIS